MGLKDFHINLKVCPLFTVPLRFLEVHPKSSSPFSHFLVSNGDRNIFLRSHTIITTHDSDTNQSHVTSSHHTK